MTLEKIFLTFVIAIVVYGATTIFCDGQIVDKILSLVVISLPALFGIWVSFAVYVYSQKGS